MTTDLEFIKSLTINRDIDAIFFDHEPDSELVKICEKIRSKDPEVPIFLTYVYNKRASQLESKIKNFVNEIFYKPFDLNEISIKLTNYSGQTAIYE